MAKSHEPVRASNGHYRVGIGFHIPNGARKGKQHSFGRDPVLAKKITAALEVAWQSETTVDTTGDRIWCDGSINRAREFAGAGPAPAPTIEPPAQSVNAPVVRQYSAKPYRAPAPIPSNLTLHQAFDLFVAYQVKRYEAHDIGEDMKNDIAFRFKSIKFHIPDCPLADCTAKHLETIRGIITKRPLCRKQGTAEDKRISVITVLNWLTTIGMAFDWFQHSKSEIGWVPTDPDWRENFSLTRRAKMK